MSEFGNGSTARGQTYSSHRLAVIAEKRATRKKLARVDKYSAPVGRVKPVGVPSRPTVQLDLFGARVK